MPRGSLETGGNIEAIGGAVEHLIPHSRAEIIRREISQPSESAVSRRHSYAGKWRRGRPHHSGGEIGGKGIIGKLQVVAVALRQGQSRPDTGQWRGFGKIDNDSAVYHDLGRKVLCKTTQGEEYR